MNIKVSHLFVTSLLALVLGITAPVNAAGKPVLVRIETTRGNIDLALDPVKAPVTVKNFLAYVDQGGYNGTIFHRVIKGFMIQGGGYDKLLAEREAKTLQEYQLGRAISFLLHLQ